MGSSSNFQPWGISRLEAFSDGVIAIIVTIMVFDLKAGILDADRSMLHNLSPLLPGFIAYAISFFTLSIMWMNHHHLVGHLRHANPSLLWRNIQLLFWMSLVPFATNLIGQNPLVWYASTVYGSTFFMIALSFTSMRSYALKFNLLKDESHLNHHLGIRKRNRIAMGLYLVGAMFGYWSVALSFLLFVIVPAMYLKVSTTSNLPKP